MPLAIGSRIGCYEIVSPIGAGGMSACGHASRRTWRSEGEHQRQFALGVGRQRKAQQIDPEISPDGRWLAYGSYESGQVEIYVRPFPNVNDGRVRISTEGGSRPAWARNGRELFYLDKNGMLTAVQVQTTGTAFKAGIPTKLLNTAFYDGTTGRGLDLRGYDVSPDGQRFLMIKDISSGNAENVTLPSIAVVMNWFTELQQKFAK